MLEVTNAATSLDLSEEVRRANKLLSETMNSVCYIHDTDSRDLEELRETGGGEEVAESLNFLLCNPFYNIRRQSQLENTSHDVFGPNDMEDLYILAKTLIKTSGRIHVLCSALQFLLL